MLRKYRSDPAHILKNQEVEITDDLSYIEEPIKIIGYKKKNYRIDKFPWLKCCEKIIQKKKPHRRLKRI